MSATWDQISIAVGLSIAVLVAIRHWRARCRAEAARRQSRAVLQEIRARIARAGDVNR
jgi:hypothetical protein